MNRLKCQCCDESKNELQKTKSKLIKGYDLTLCKTCKSQNYEPRFIVILAANKLGIENKIVRDFIENHKFIGSAILVTDVL